MVPQGENSGDQMEAPFGSSSHPITLGGDSFLFPGSSVVRKSVFSKVVEKEEAEARWLVTREEKKTIHREHSSLP